MYYLNIQSWETVYFWGNADFPKGEPKHTEAQVAFKVNFILAPELDSWFPNTYTGSFCLSLLDSKYRGKGKENKDSKTKWKRVDDNVHEDGERAKGMKIAR